MEIRKKRKIVIAIIAAILLAAGALECALNWRIVAEFFHSEEPETEVIEEEFMMVDDLKIPASWWINDGYLDFDSWWIDICAAKQEVQDIATTTIDEYGEYITDEYAEQIDLLLNDAQDSYSLLELKGYITELNDLTLLIIGSIPEPEPEPVYYEPSYSSNYNSSSITTSSDPYNFKRDGVVYQDGTRYTWYSSNVAYHYRTGEWSAGDDGLYRDSNGYIIVASSDHAQGTIVSTPYGEGIVQDTGCVSGTIDIYTNY